MQLSTHWSCSSTHRPALPPCTADLYVRCRGPSPEGRRSSAAVRRWTRAAPDWGERQRIRRQCSYDVSAQPEAGAVVRTRRAWTCSWRSARLARGGRGGKPGGSSWSRADRSAAPTCSAWCRSTWRRWSAADTEATPNCQFLADVPVTRCRRRRLQRGLKSRRENKTPLCFFFWKAQGCLLVSAVLLGWRLFDVRRQLLPVREKERRGGRKKMAHLVQFH